MWRGQAFAWWKQYKSSSSAELLYIPGQKKSCQTSFNLRPLYLHMLQLLNEDSLIDARVQAEKCKGNTARQGLPSLLATSHCYTTQPGEAVSPCRDGVKFRLSQARVWLTEIFFFPFICKALTSAGRYPRRPCLMRSRCWHKPSRLPTPTALGGDAAELSCRLAEWAFFGTPGPFLKDVAPPEWWEGSLSREITQGVDRCVGVLPALGSQGREAAPYQQLEGPGGAKHGVAGLCS